MIQDKDNHYWEERQRYPQAKWLLYIIPNVNVHLSGDMTLPPTILKLVLCGEGEQCNP